MAAGLFARIPLYPFDSPRTLLESMAIALSDRRAHVEAPRVDVRTRSSPARARRDRRRAADLRGGGEQPGVLPGQKHAARDHRRSSGSPSVSEFLSRCSGSSARSERSASAQPPRSTACWSRSSSAALVMPWFRRNELLVFPWDALIATSIGLAARSPAFESASFDSS